MHTAITPGVLSAPWETARWHRPRPFGTTVHVHQSHQQGAKTGSARTPACSLDTAEMEDTQDISRGGRLEGTFIVCTTGPGQRGPLHPQPPAAQVEEGRVLIPLPGDSVGVILRQQ